MPIGETGSAAFLAAHPTWDGRGITIGIVDTGVDLLHPALATTSTGERKILDWVAGTDPVTDNDPTWLESTTDVVAKDGKFTVGTTHVHRADEHGSLLLESVQRGRLPLHRK